MLEIFVLGKVSLVRECRVKEPVTKEVTTEAVAQRCSVKKGVIRIFPKFTGKHSATLLKERLWHR